MRDKSKIVSRIVVARTKFSLLREANRIKTLVEVTNFVVDPIRTDFGFASLGLEV
jgi:hypothetical protein